MRARRRNNKCSGDRFLATVFSGTPQRRFIVPRLIPKIVSSRFYSPSSSTPFSSPSLSLFFSFPRSFSYHYVNKRRISSLVAQIPRHSLPWTRGYGRKLNHSIERREYRGSIESQLERCSFYLFFPPDKPTNAHGIGSIDAKIRPSPRSDNEASLARSDSGTGTGIETYSEPGCRYLPSPPPTLSLPLHPPILVLLLFFTTQLPPYAAFTYLFPCRTARMAVINRARVAGIRGVQRATCCCLHVSTYSRKKRLRTTVPPSPFATLL